MLFVCVSALRLAATDGEAGVWSAGALSKHVRHCSKMYALRIVSLTGHGSVPGARDFPVAIPQNEAFLDTVL
jgi:hypothetical protein